MKTLQTLTYDEWLQWCSTLPKASVWYLPDTVIEHFAKLIHSNLRFHEQEAFGFPPYEIRYKRTTVFRRVSTYGFR